MKFMQKSHYKLLALIVTLTLIILPTTVLGSIVVGVNEGDWIEYNVEIREKQANDPTINIPSDHSISWARMEVTEVQGQTINLDIETKFVNGTIIAVNTILNLDTGTLGDDFIIPANLTAGDSFFDKHQGNITITSSQVQVIAGAQRNVISGATQETLFYWDQLTGVLINAESTFTDYSITTQLAKTNLWVSQPLISPEKTPTPDLHKIELETGIILAIIVIIGTILLIVLIVSYLIKTIKRINLKSNNS